MALRCMHNRRFNITLAHTICMPLEPTSSLNIQSGVQQHILNTNLSHFLPDTSSTFACVDSRSEYDVLVGALAGWFG